MGDAVEQVLAKHFPIYQSRGELTDETQLDTVGFDCGPGWVPLLIEFAQSAECLDIFNVQISQIKEKWNTLCIYYSADGIDQQNFEETALDIEVCSASICEICSNHYDQSEGCCRNGNCDSKVINELMLKLIEDKPFH